MIAIRFRCPLFIALLVCLAFSISGLAQTAYEHDCEKLATDKRNDTERLHELFKLNWDYTMHEYPEFATQVGYPGLNDRWTDNSPAAITRRQHELQPTLKVVQSIKRSKLNATDQLDFDLFKRDIELGIEGIRFHDELMPVNQMGGVQQDAAQMLEISPRATVKDYENILARLNALPMVIDQTIVLMEKGLAAGITPPRITLRDVPDQVASQMNPDSQKNALLKPFAEFPMQISEADRVRLREEAAVVLKEKVVPAFMKLHEFLVKTYLSGARESIGLGALPDGSAWYAYNVRVTTTTTLTPEQIHKIGLAEVKRIRAEMDKVIAQTRFKGSFTEFSKFVRTDPQFYYTNADDLLTGYRDIAKRIDPELPRLFGKLPRLTYGVVPVPDYAAKSQTSAYYMPGSPAAGRAGDFFANTYALNTRAKWEMESLTLHESVPGHHLQIALAQEMDDASEFRKEGRYTAFVEGWGLYAESLGGEIGLYKDPYSRYGQLTFEMWRAIRLVVDTGIHSMGWTRQQAIDYFLTNSSKSEHEVAVEVDRYIVWPGQALAYKIGQLKIRELREYATRELGDKFDVRKFHDQVLDNGALPLDVLEARIKSWVKEQKSSGN
ncbi:MAG: DUF885 domain-containing protein [Limisphaerales bacterium]